MGIRRKARELALQFLFEQDFQTEALDVESIDERQDRFFANFEVSAKAVPYARELISGIVGYRAELDSLIASNSRNWRVERMSLVDRNLLRIALFEIRYADDVPGRVAINEALEIAKRFSTDKSVAFINGILDSLQR